MYVWSQIHSKTSLLASSAILLTCAIFVSASTHAAQSHMYKWIGPNGKVVYSDKPPPADAKKLGSKPFESSSNVSTANLPSDLALVVNKNPVTFYASPACSPCNEARNLLKQKGIPFAEKTIKTNEDIEKLRQISGDTFLPFLVINKSKFKNYDEQEWRTALAAAGYPETSLLPKDYRYPDPEPAAPLPPSTKKDGEEKASEPIKPRSSSPTGIRF